MQVKYLLIALVVMFAVGALGGSSYAKIDPETIAGLWLFEEEGEDTEADLSENGNDGAIKGDPKWAEGKFGKAMEFDGEDNWVEVKSSNIATGEELTLSVLVKPDIQTFGNWQAHRDIVRSHKYGGGTWGISTHVEFNQNDLVRFQLGWIQGGDPWWIPANTLAAKGEWNHLAVVWNRNTGQATFYRNGQSVNETKVPVGAKPVTTGLSIGSDHAGPFKGFIDEVAVFNVALSEDDIKTIATRGMAGALDLTAVSPAGKLATAWGGIKAGG